MRKKWIRALCLLLCVSTLAVSFVACGETDDPADTGNTATTTAGAGDESGAEVTTEKLDDYGRPWLDADIPEKNYNGMEFRVHTRGNVEQYEWLAEEQNGETLHDGIYRRNKNVEELLGVKIVTIAEGSWSNYDSELIPKIQNNIKTNAYAYDLLAGYSKVTALATSGLLYDLEKLDYIDFEKPWWSKSFNDNANIHGKNYFAVGSLSISMIYSMECIFVNTDILRDCESSYNIYQTVKDQKWTLDEIARLSGQAWVDKNSNGIADAEDTVGLSFPDTGNSASGFFYACGAKLTTYDADNTPSFDAINVEKIGSIIDGVIKLFHNTDGVAYKNPDKVKFTDGNALFNFRWLYWGQTEYAPAMDHYGIVPMPKLNLDQLDYSTPVQGGMHQYCIPTDVSDVEADSIITEALAAESYRSLVPAYFEVVLKTRYSKDAETSQMLDIMYDTVDFEFCYIWRNDINYQSSVVSMVQNNQNNFSSQYKSLSKVANASLKKLISTIDEKP